MFLGLHSSVIHKASRFSSSSELLSSFACFAISLLRSIPTPPPSLCFLLFPIHLYPLMLIFWFFVSFVSDISAICIFTAVRRDSMLSSFSFIPFGFIAAMVRFLFFLILTLLCFFFLVFYHRVVLRFLCFSVCSSQCYLWFMGLFWCIFLVFFRLSIGYDFFLVEVFSVYFSKWYFFMLSGFIFAVCCF